MILNFVIVCIINPCVVKQFSLTFWTSVVSSLFITGKKFLFSLNLMFCVGVQATVEIGHYRHRRRLFSLMRLKQFQFLLDAAHAWVKQWALLVDNNQLVHEVFACNVWCSQWRWYSWNVRIHYPFLCLFTLMCGVLMHMLWLSMASIKSNRRKMQSFVLDIGIPVMCYPLAVNHQPVWLCEGADMASRWFSLFVFSYFWG